MQLHKKTSIVSGKDEQAPKHSFAASLDDGSRKALQSKMKSSIRKARDDKDKTDNAEQVKKQTAMEPKSPTKGAGRGKSSGERVSSQAAKEKGSKHADPTSGKGGDERPERKNKSANEKRLSKEEKQGAKQAK